MPEGFMAPDRLAAYLDGVSPPEGWEVVVSRAPGVPASDHAAAGATWLIDSTWPEGDWVAEMRARIRSGPGA